MGAGTSPAQQPDLPLGCRGPSPHAWPERRGSGLRSRRHSPRDHGRSGAGAGARGPVGSRVPWLRGPGCPFPSQDWGGGQEDEQSRDTVGTQYLPGARSRQRPATPGSGQAGVSGPSGDAARAVVWGAGAAHRAGVWTTPGGLTRTRLRPLEPPGMGRGAEGDGWSAATWAGAPTSPRAGLWPAQTTPALADLGAGKTQAGPRAPVPGEEGACPPPPAPAPFRWAGRRESPGSL